MSASVSSNSAKCLPNHLEDIRKNVFVNSTHLEHTNAAEDPDAFRALEFDNSFDIEEWKKHFTIKIVEKTDERIVFDMIGAGAPIANALRRALIADVPTMAIEKVILYQNTSVIQDEVLSHRLGLIPIYADPNMFTYVAGDQPNEHNTTVMTLEVSCTVNPKASLSAPTDLMYNNSVVYSRDLKWVPQGHQATTFANDPIRPVHNDIVVAKLRPGQSIEAELHIVKGVGSDHAKWSPAATVFYRQMPDISFTEPIYGEAAVQIASEEPEVFGLEDSNDGKGPHLIVVNPRNYTMNRNCVRDPENEKKIKLRRVRDHFIFTVESSGSIKPEVMIREAIKSLKEKVETILNAIDVKTNLMVPTVIPDDAD